MEEEEGGRGGEIVRIYVGGLGEKVTADDLKKMLSPALGRVQAAEIVRSKGRSFGYLDLVPSSPASLSKLFTTYNGCAWKGGKLRLERAKEHYLARLHREWAQASQLVTNEGPQLDASASSSSSEMPPTQLGPTHKNLRIFFPRLGKVKAIPFTGTGKHKYSFRRVEFSSPPKYFCDCDEHSSPSHLPKEEQSLTLEAQGAGMNEKEIQIMNSVIDKLFARENISDSLPSKTQGKSQTATSSNIIDSPLADESNSAADEDDDLVINVAGPAPQTVLADEVSKLKVRPVAKDGPPLDAMLKKEGKDAPHCKKPRSAFMEDNDAYELNSSISGGEKVCQVYSNARPDLFRAADEKPESDGKQSVPAPCSGKSPWRKLVGHGANNPFSVSDILRPAGSSKVEEPKSDKLVISNDDDQTSTLQKMTSLEHLAEAKTCKPGSSSIKTGRGSAWLHKSSWTQLICGGSSSSSSGFSIRQILPDGGLEKQDIEIHDQGAFSSGNNRSDRVEEGKSGPNKDSANENRNEQDTLRNDHGVGPCLSEGNNESNVVKSRKDDVAIGETCLFMRTAASVKEWANMKASLSGSRKRKKQS